MSYHKDKMKALDFIDEMLANGLSLVEMEFKLSKAHGFGLPMIKERIKLVEKFAREREIKAKMRAKKEKENQNE